MTLSTLKDKGQITLPADIRKDIGAKKGDLFEFEIVDGKVIMTPQKLVPATRSRPKRKTGTDLSKWIGSMKGSFGSVEEIDEYIRKERNSWD